MASGESICICPHCDCKLSRKTYNTHKRLYYNKESDQWIKKRCLIPNEHRDTLVSTEVALEEFDLIGSSSGEESTESHPDRPPLADFCDKSFDIPLEGTFNSTFEDSRGEKGRPIHICMPTCMVAIGFDLYSYVSS